MAHVNSGSFRDERGKIYLWQTDKEGKPIKKIGGPYETETDATRASKAVSQRVGEAPVEDYQKYLGRRKALGGLLDFFIDKTSTQADEPPRTLIPEPDVGFVTDIKYDPKAHRVPVNPDPSRYPADMSEVKFGTALPERVAVEDMILEASSLSGVQPEYTEGHRTEEQNKLVGGDPASKHLQGQAFDLAISGDKSKDEAYERALRRLFGPLGFSVVLKSDHVHLQTPPPGVELLPNSSWR